jgi:hypothetical protein
MKKIIDFFTKGYDSTLNNIVKAILIAVPTGVFIGWAYPGYPDSYRGFFGGWVFNIKDSVYGHYYFFYYIYKELAIVSSITLTLVLFLIYNTKKQ